MAEALETKKRRLYKLLDNMSTSSLTTTTSTTPSADSNKRPQTAAERFDEARERASKRLRHSSSTSSLASSLPTKVAPAKSTPRKASENKTPPNFSPWSSETFLQRLKTFSSVSLWHPKPEGIGEVEWAKRGWRCVDVNTVACKGGCERRVVVALEGKQKERRAQEEGAEEDEEDEEEAHEELERALVARYSKVIAEGHAENCMWRTSGCRDDVYRVQVVRPSVWQPELRKRCRSVLAINAAVVNVAFKALETEDAKTQPASRLVKDLPADLIGNEDAAADEVHATKSLTIALHGWRGSTEAGSELLNCDTCFQRIGLWMYQPDYKRSRHPHPDATDGAEEDLPIIDLQELHREHCPWRNAQAQVATGSLAGLNASQILQRIVASYARDVRRRSNEQSTETHSHAEDKGNEANGEADKRTPKASREEIVKQDRERESRLRKLKSMFSVRRKSTKAPTPAR